MLKQALVLAAALAMVGPVLAATPVLNAREHHQRTRIVQGVKSGALTAPEAARLRRGQTHLERMEQRAKSDGVVTSAERARLDHNASVQSRRIHTQKHDAQHRN